MLYLLAGIDTECDRRSPSEARLHPRFENIAALPRLHTLLQKHRVRPTYLVTHPVATDARSASMLREMRQGRDCEIGGLHHTSETPPYSDEDTRRRPFASQLPQGRFAAQVTSLTAVITEAVGEPPLSYRSGSFGFSASHVPDLEHAGYRIDSSVVPLLYDQQRGGPDFAGARPTPYFLAYDDPTSPGTSNLLELPVTAALSRRMPAIAEYLCRQALRHGAARRALQSLGAARVQRLQPSVSTLDDMRSLARRIKEDGVPLLNLILRSSEVSVGGGPEISTPEELERFLDRLEAVLGYIVSELGAIPVTFSEFRALYCGTNRNPSAE